MCWILASRLESHSLSDRLFCLFFSCFSLSHSICEKLLTVRSSWRRSMNKPWLSSAPSSRRSTFCRRLESFHMHLPTDTTLSTTICINKPYPINSPLWAQTSPYHQPPPSKHPTQPTTLSSSGPHPVNSPCFLQISPLLAALFSSLAVLFD